MRSDKTLVSKWPGHLVERIIARQFVLVVGAGVSRACTNDLGDAPPSWTELLEKLIIEFLTPNQRTAARRAVREGDFLGAAELVRSRARSSNREHDYYRAIVDAVGGGKKAESKYNPGPIHEALLRLDPDFVITTNYDKLLERAAQDGYSVHSYKSDNVDVELMAGKPLLIKLHGTTDDSADLILTRSDFSNLRRRGARTLELVQAMFLTRTVLFVGYGFSDPDILLLLENVLGGRGGAPSHYLLTASSIPAHVQEVNKYCYGTTAVTYTDGDYGEMLRMLELLADQVDAGREPAA